MTPARFVGCLILGTLLIGAGLSALAQEKDKDIAPKISKEDAKKLRDAESKRKLDALEKEVAEEKAREAAKKKEKPKDDKTSTVILQIAVPRDCKITVNNKDVTYEKFEVLMEYAGTAFTTEELVYRGGSMSSIKLRLKE